MPLFDKVKASAAQMTQLAHEAGRAGQTKVADLQGRRRAESMLEDLGRAVLAERTGRSGPEGAAEIERLVAALVALEAEQGAPVGVAPVDGVAPVAGGESWSGTLAASTTTPSAPAPAPAAAPVPAPVTSDLPAPAPAEQPVTSVPVARSEAVPDQALPSEQASDAAAPRRLPF